MHIDPSHHAPGESYKLLTNLVVPRPIAWITSQNEAGVINLAPFSFFNAVSGNPPFVVVGIGGLKESGEEKDTALNIKRSGEFVVNLVTEALLTAMNISAADFPADVSELSVAGLHVAPSQKIAVPRLAESQASLECKLHSVTTLGRNNVFISEIVMFHVADPLLGPRLHINGFAPIGRMGSPSTYCRTHDRFELPRISYKDFKLQSLATPVLAPSPLF